MVNINNSMYNIQFCIYFQDTTPKVNECKLCDKVISYTNTAKKQLTFFQNI